jgi:hypothetical protein
MTENERDQSRGEAMGEGTTHKTPTAMDEQAGSELPPLPWATGDVWGDVVDANGLEVAEFMDGAVQDRVIAIVNAHEELAEVHEAAMAFVACVGDGDGEWTEAEIEGLRYLRAILAKVRA